MHYEKLFPSRFIKGADFSGKDVTLTISHVVGEEIEDETKMVVAFEGTKKQWVVNRTNAEHLALMFGPETKGWHGKRVTLHAPVLPNPFAGGEQTPMVRVLGSPDLARQSKKVVRRGRSTINVDVKPTGKAQPTKARAAPAQAPVSGEPPEDMILPGQTEPPPFGDEDSPFPEAQ